MSLKNAFNALLKFKQKVVTLYRPGTALSVSASIASSNYSRNLETSANTIVKGREFILSKADLDKLSYPTPKRGDKINHPDLGILTISEVNEITELGDEIMGYRVRTS